MPIETQIFRPMADGTVERCILRQALFAAPSVTSASQLNQNSAADHPGLTLAANGLKAGRSKAAPGSCLWDAPGLTWTGLDQPPEQKAAGSNPAGAQRLHRSSAADRSRPRMQSHAINCATSSPTAGELFRVVQLNITPQLRHRAFEDDAAGQECAQPPSRHFGRP